MGLDRPASSSPLSGAGGDKAAVSAVQRSSPAETCYKIRELRERIYSYLDHASLARFARTERGCTQVAVKELYRSIPYWGAEALMGDITVSI
jgi:hypothetical protein